MIDFQTPLRAPRRGGMGLVLALAVLAVGAACKDSSGPRATAIPRALLNGDYVCTRMLAFYKGSQGTGWYTGNCNAYIAATNPSRRDSIETFPFTVYASDIVRWPDFTDGTLQYDSSARVAVVQYPDRPSAVYAVDWDGARTVLEQRFLPFDFTGDGQADSLQLTFVRQ